MKTIQKLLVIVTVACLVACQQNETPDLPGPNIQVGEIDFSFIEKLVDSNDGGRKGSAGRTENAVPDQIVVTIVNNEGTTILSQEHLNVTEVNGNYISERITLLVGTYQLTEYFVEDADGNAIYVAPLNNSNLAYLVDEPLPKTFDLTVDENETVNPEVLSTENVDAADFGYPAFTFNVVATFDFLLSVYFLNESNLQYENSDASVMIIGDSDEDGAFVANLGPETNQIRLRDTYQEYTISITKGGYHTESRLLDNNTLKSHLNEPLSVLIEPTLTYRSLAGIQDVEFNNYINATNSDGESVCETAPVLRSWENWVIMNYNDSTSMGTVNFGDVIGLRNNEFNVFLSGVPDNTRLTVQPALLSEERWIIEDPNDATATDALQSSDTFYLRHVSSGLYADVTGAAVQSEIPLTATPQSSFRWISTDQ